MKQAHPLLRGFALAAVFTLMMTLLGTPRLMQLADFSSLDARLLVFAAMTVLGAFVAAIPGRLERLHAPWRRSTAKGCAAVFIGGLLTALGLGMAGAGDLRILCGALQGGLGALAFVGCAWLTAAVTALVTGRRRV